MNADMLKKVRVDELRLGMFLHGLCGAWMDHPFWKSQFKLSDQPDLDKLRASGVKECWIDLGKGLDVASFEPELPPAAQAAAPVSRPAASAVVGVKRNEAPLQPPPASVPLAEETARAAGLVNESRQAVMSLFAEARMGKALDTSGCAALVNEVTASVWRNPGAMLSLARLKRHDDYTYMHSVAVCALMVALARQLGLGEERAREAGMAGLLHDMGKAAMPLTVLTKAGRLSAEEFSVMRSHPERGHAMLAGREVELAGSLGSITDGVLDVCLHHHERVDGSGYPHGLKGEEISLLAKMGAVCDVYDAITSTRPYKAAWDPAESIGKMASWRKGHFDEAVFHAFVKSLGIYPVGALVRMKSDRLGVVVEQNETAITSPKVKLFYSARTNMPIVPLVLDLADPRCNDRIAGRESNSVWQFPHLDGLWAGEDALRKLARG
jgi:HD-GYP domain-containing protein (c-di-GMP phosphodiesterase class II)